eukprot:s60_g22.t1
MHPDSSVVLKITCRGEIFRFLLGKGLGSLDLGTVQGAIHTTCGSEDVRYVALSGCPTILSESTFNEFLQTATRPAGAAPAPPTLRLEVVQKESNLPWSSWQQDTRDIEELLAQFSDDDLVKIPSKKRKGKNKRKKKTVPKKKPVSPEPSSDESDSDTSQSRHLSRSVNDTYMAESLAASAQCLPSADEDSDEAGEAECSSQNDAAGDLQLEQLDPWDSEEDLGGMIRSRSCPCFRINTQDEEDIEEIPESQLWPATPESTPRQSPRNCGFMWVPVMMMPAPPISAF